MSPRSPLLDPDARLVVGHRGNSAHAPENTLESLRQAVDLGVDAIEFDLRLTRDGVAVVHHDPTLDRTTTGSGPLEAKSLDQLRQLDAGARYTDARGGHPYAGKGITIPTFAEVLEAFPAAHCIIELKVPEVAEEARRVIEAHGAEDRVIVDSFVPGALEPFRGSRIAVGGSSSGAYRILRGCFLGAPARGSLDFHALCIPWRYRGISVPIAAMVRTARKAGLVTHVWTVDDEHLAEKLWGVGVNAVISNDPARMLRLRERLRERKSEWRREARDA